MRQIPLMGSPSLRVITVSRTWHTKLTKVITLLISNACIAAAQLARKAADKVTAEDPDKRWRLVAGAVGPTNRTASVSPKVEDPSFRNTNYIEIKDAYKT